MKFEIWMTCIMGLLFASSAFCFSISQSENSKATDEMLFYIINYESVNTLSSINLYRLDLYNSQISLKNYEDINRNSACIALLLFKNNLNSSESYSLSNFCFNRSILDQNNTFLSDIDFNSTMGPIEDYKDKFNKIFESKENASRWGFWGNALFIFGVFSLIFLIEKEVIVTYFERRLNQKG